MQHHPDQTDEARSAGKDAHDRRPALDLLVESLLGVRAPNLAAVGLGESEMSQEVWLGFEKQARYRGEANGETSPPSSSASRRFVAGRAIKLIGFVRANVLRLSFAVVALGLWALTFRPGPARAGPAPGRRRILPRFYRWRRPSGSPTASDHAARGIRIRSTLSSKVAVQRSIDRSSGRARV
jgi:hypothetical protein